MRVNTPTVFGLLESAANAEPKDGLLFIKNEGKAVDELVAARPGIISINQAKRHVENGYLNAKLSSQTAVKIAESCELALAQPRDRVRLRLTPNENWLEAKREQGQRINLAGLCGLKLSLGHEAIITRNQTQKRRCSKLRLIAKDESAQAGRAGRYESGLKSRTRNSANRGKEWLISKKFAGIALIAFSANIKR